MTLIFDLSSNLLYHDLIYSVITHYISYMSYVYLKEIFGKISCILYLYKMIGIERKYEAT